MFGGHDVLHYESLVVFVVILFFCPTVYSADLAFLLQVNCTPDPNLDFRAVYHLGIAKSAAIWVGPQLLLFIFTIAIALMNNFGPKN